MQINRIDNNSTLKFQGILILNAGLEVRGPGFPRDDDAKDLFEYRPFKDDTIEDIELDEVKMKQLACYYETQQLENDKYAYRQINGMLYPNDRLSCSKDEFKHANINSDEKKKILNLSEIQVENIVDEVQKMKKHLRKGQPLIRKDGSLFFKYM